MAPQRAHILPPTTLDGGVGQIEAFENRSVNSAFETRISDMTNLDVNCVSSSAAYPQPAHSDASFGLVSTFPGRTFAKVANVNPELGFTRSHVGRWPRTPAD